MNPPALLRALQPGVNFPSQCADRIAGSLQSQLASSGSSPAPVEIEAHDPRHRAPRRAAAGQRRAFHHQRLEANYTALVCLSRAGRASRRGAARVCGPVAMYTSRECQPAWFKIVHQAGVGRDALRLIGTYGRRPHGRRRTRARHRRGRARGVVPVLISPTAGTTAAGMSRPAYRVRAAGAPLWPVEPRGCGLGRGGARLERLRKLFTGIELADSITIDALLWFATTMGCGMFITRHPQV